MEVKEAQVENKGSVRKGRLNTGEREEIGRTGEKKNMGERGSLATGKCLHTGTARLTRPLLARRPES